MIGDNIRRGIADIERIRDELNNAKRYGHKHKARMLEADIERRKGEVKDIIQSRDYEWRE